MTSPADALADAVEPAMVILFPAIVGLGLAAIVAAGVAVVRWLRRGRSAE